MTFDVELNELNERYYALYGRLFENAELMEEKPARYMGDKIFEQYKKEYDALALKWSIPQKQEMFELKVKHGTLVPRNKFFIFKNRAKKLTLKELGLTLNDEFEAREKAYNARLQAHNVEIVATINAAETPTDAAQTPETKTNVENAEVNGELRK